MDTESPDIGPQKRIRCAVPGCRNFVSAKRAVQAHLTPYCSNHRRQYSTVDSDAIPASERIANSPPILPTSADRVFVERLVAKLAPGSAEVVAINPGVAAVLLERNAQNRSITANRVDTYARDMIAGAWQVNNQGVALGLDGRLFDGQHRLQAVVRSHKTVSMLVCGVREESRSTIDQGRTRSLGDNLRILDGHHEGSRIVAWFNALESLTAKRRAPLSHAMVRRQLERYSTSVHWLMAHGPRVRPFYRAALAGALLYAHRVLPTEVEHFTARYVSGANLAPGSPILTLRDYMAAATNERPRAIALKVLRAFLAELRGEDLDKLYSTEEGLEHVRKLHEELAVVAA